MPIKFRIEKKAGKARAGVIDTPHGKIHTPYFMPVATKAVVKAITQDDLREMDAELLMCNTYHLMLQPGADLVAKIGGLHKFMNWSGPLITDSGGFQAFSLGYGMEHFTGKFSSYFVDEDKKKQRENKRKKSTKFDVAPEKLALIDDEGANFQSIYDKSIHKVGPKESIAIQEKLRADIMIAFDECTSPLSDKKYVKESMERTHRWAKECLDVKKTDRAMFGVVQGSYYKDLRTRSAKTIASLGFDGYGIGGSLGKTKEDMIKILGWTMPYLEENKPRHLLGIGTVEDFFYSVENGIDLFDCVGPTRIARVGYAYLSPESDGNLENKHRLKIHNSKYKDDKRPLDPFCKCKVCRQYSRAYIRHLLKAREYTGHILMSYHNLYFMINLVKEIRESVLKGKFKELKKRWIE